MDIQTTTIVRASLKVLFSLFLICSSIPVAKSQVYRTTRYADNNGLPSRIVRDMIQDSDGFIWVAGNNGLYRFDGEEFKPYLSALKDTVGLRDNKITALVESKKGDLWIGTPKGLHLLQNNQIRHLPIIDNPSDNQQYINNIFEDSDDNLWVATYGGLFLLESNTNEVVHFLTEDRGDLELSRGTVWAATEDFDNRVWVATNDGFFRINMLEGYAIEKVTLVVAPTLKSKDIGFYKIQQYNDELFIIDSSQGLLKGNLLENTLHIAPFLNEKGEKVEKFSVERSIIEEEGTIWLTTWKDGLRKLRIIEGRLVEEQIISVNGFKEMTSTSYSVYKDAQHNIWTANTNGLYKLSIDDRLISTFPPYECSLELKGIYGIIEDKGQNLWITTPTTLYRFKKGDLLKNNCPTQYLSFSDENMQLARYLFIDSANRLWVGADGGLFVTQLDADYNPGKFKRYTIKDGLPHNTSKEIHEAAKDSFWIGNYSGLVQLNLKEGSFDNPSVKVYKANKSEQNRLVNSYVYSIERDGKGKLWLGTYSGVSMLLDSSKEGVFTNYSSQYGNNSGLSNNSIKKIFRDSNNQLWIATQRGLNLYQPQKGTFLQFGHAEGMPSEYILGIDEDSKGNLWICTTNGVLKAQFDQRTMGFINTEHYTSNDGLADNIPYRNSIHIDEWDNVFIGSRDGISVFRADEGRNFTAADFAMKVTEIQSTQKKELGFKSVLNKLNNGELILPYYENSLKVKCVVLDYVKPENNTYRHKLLPVNEKWVETGGNPEIYYYNLNHGDYELVLDAADSKGIWSDTPITLKIKIKPPFWKSNWAYVLYCSAFGGLLWWGYRARIRKERQIVEQQMALKQARLEEREQLRSENTADFHDELGAKLTKISMFLTLTERSWSQKEDPKEWLGKIRDNVKELSTSFRDLLWMTDPKKDNLGAAFTRLKDFGEELFKGNGTQFKAQGYHEAWEGIPMDAQAKKQWLLIFKEAMNNSAKYAHAKDVIFSVIQHNGKIDAYLEDNGRGFNTEQMGKGRGLKNMKDRANRIGVDLNIRSSKKGTKISLTGIPHMGEGKAVETL